MIDRIAGTDVAYRAHAIIPQLEPAYTNFCSSLGPITSKINQNQLVLSNCTMTFVPQADTEQNIWFVGMTGANACDSTFRGAEKLTIYEVVRDGEIRIQERWWNSLGEIVAGAPLFTESIYRRTNQTSYPYK
jgi:hypothetical protein